MVSSRFSWAEALDPCHGIPDRRPLVRQEGHAGAVAQAAAVELQRLRLPEAAQLDLDGAVLADGEGHVVPPWRYVAHRITSDYFEDISIRRYLIVGCVINIV